MRAMIGRIALTILCSTLIGGFALGSISAGGDQPFAIVLAGSLMFGSLWAVAVGMVWFL